MRAHDVDCLVHVLESFDGGRRRAVGKQQCDAGPDPSGQALDGRHEIEVKSSVEQRLMRRGERGGVRGSDRESATATKLLETAGSDPHVKDIRRN